MTTYNGISPAARFLVWLATWPQAYCCRSALQLSTRRVLWLSCSAQAQALGPQVQSWRHKVPHPMLALQARQAGKAG